MPASTPSEIAPLQPSPAQDTPKPSPAPRPGKPAWMRNAVFKLFSSVKLAVVLLSVLIVASIAGTIYETSFDARVARAYIYNAWWFNLWLTILCLNLTCSAFSRWPWKRHHTGFLLTHLGIIVLLIGAMIGRRWGIEGTMTVFKGNSPDNRLEIVDENVLRVEEGGDHGVQQFPVEIIGRHPTPAKPWRLGQTPGGWDLTLVDYAPALNAAFEPQAVTDGSGAGQSAVRVRLTSKRLKRTIEEWLLLGDSDHGAIDLQLAAVTLQPGVAPEVAAGSAPAKESASTRETVDERIFSLLLHPGEGKRLPAPGTNPSGVDVQLKSVDGKPTVVVTWQGATWNFDPVADRAKPDSLGDSGLTVVVEDYWPDLVVKAESELSTASDQPNNPAVLVRVHGRAGAAESTPAEKPTPAPGGMSNIGTSADNAAAIYCDPTGKLTYTLKSSALPKPMRGELPLNKAINTGWADWQVEALQVMASAAPHTEFRPVPAGETATAGPMMDGSPGDNRAGVRVKLVRGTTTLEQWAPLGWEFTLPTTPGPLRLAYGPRIEAMPIGLQLDHFEVTFNEGTENPASFRSYLKVTDVEGETGNGSCSMNHPYNFPGNWWNTFSGLTFKMSQASWNPQNRNESVIQILRDPGWLLKWIGSLLVCSGIFTLFYLRPTPTRGSVVKPSEVE